MNTTKVFVYPITFSGDNLALDPEVGTLISVEYLFEGEELEEGAENPIVSKTYQRELRTRAATLFMSVKREQMLYEFQKAQDEKRRNDETINPIHLVLETIYFPLVACSDGEVPTFQEFAFILSDEDAEAWGALVRELNPHWWGEEKKSRI